MGTSYSLVVVKSNAHLKGYKPTLARELVEDLCPEDILRKMGTTR